MFGKGILAGRDETEIFGTVCRIGSHMKLSTDSTEIQLV